MTGSAVTESVVQPQEVLCSDKCITGSAATGSKVVTGSKYSDRNYSDSVLQRQEVQLVTGSAATGRAAQ